MSLDRDKRLQLVSSDGAPVARASRRARILIVEDDELLMRALRRSISQVHDVTSAVDGQAALELIEAGARFDVVFCDIMMPRLDGIELYEAVRDRFPELSSRFVMMSGAIHTERAQEFLKREKPAFVEKPFYVEILDLLINERLRVVP
ncbi:response regulator [Anaeromyxobacter paludicola]|uniref:response regulator n=1 Tax=Anaeromyxobacter paludicola TaxID=2918171 RepID=UPI0020BFEB6B|nr:response regulator [Anaeromyxobacter paludicola]